MISSRKFGTVSRPDRSAVFEMGKTKVIAAVYGPCEYKDISCLYKDIVTFEKIESIQKDDVNENDREVLIDVPDEIIIDAVDDRVMSIIDFTYPHILYNINDLSYCQEKIILAPTNEAVDTINDHLLEKFPGEETVYLSCDNIDKTKRDAAIDQSIFSREFMNGLKFSCVPNHRLTLKVGVPIMLLRDLIKQMDCVKGQDSNKRGLKVVVCDEDDYISKTTTHVVYIEVLQGSIAVLFGLLLISFATTTPSEAHTLKSLEQKKQFIVPMSEAMAVGVGGTYE
ncbi:ATP-dependent DNA helicase PIF1-like protein [Tanacetum coccineum]